MNDHFEPSPAGSDDSHTHTMILDELERAAASANRQARKRRLGGSDIGLDDPDLDLCDMACLHAEAAQLSLSPRLGQVQNRLRQHGMALCLDYNVLLSFDDSSLTRLALTETGGYSLTGLMMDTVWLTPEIVMLETYGPPLPVLIDRTGSNDNAHNLASARFPTLLPELDTMHWLLPSNDDDLLTDKQLLDTMAAELKQMQGRLWKNRAQTNGQAAAAEFVCCKVNLAAALHLYLGEAFAKLAGPYREQDIAVSLKIRASLNLDETDYIRHIIEGKPYPRDDLMATPADIALTVALPQLQSLARS